MEKVKVIDKDGPPFIKLEPIKIIRWRCPICNLEYEDKQEVIDHIKNISFSIGEISYGTPVAIKNRYPAKTFSVARVKDYFYNELHIRIYNLDRLLFFKDSDHFPEDLVGRVVSEYEIIKLDELEDYLFCQARCFQTEDLNSLLEDLHLQKF